MTFTCVSVANYNDQANSVVEMEALCLLRANHTIALLESHCTAGPEQAQEVTGMPQVLYLPKCPAQTAYI